MLNKKYIRKPYTEAQKLRRAEKDSARHLRNKTKKHAIDHTQNEPNFMGNKWSPEEDMQFKEEMKQLYLKSEEQIPMRYRIGGGSVAITQPIIQTPIQTPVVNNYVTFTPRNYTPDELLQIEFARRTYSSNQFNTLMYNLNRG